MGYVDICFSNRPFRKLWFLQFCHTRPDFYVLSSLHHHAQCWDLWDIQKFPLCFFTTALSPADPCCTRASETFHVSRSGISGGISV